MHRTNDEEVPTVLTTTSENATNIHPTDAPTEKLRQKYARLSKYNRGIWNGPKRENKEVTLHQDNLAIFDALAGQVSLTQYQKAEGRKILTGLNLRDIGRSVTLIAFSICALVANDEVPEGHRYWPTAKDSDEEFERVAEGIEFSDNAILSGMMTIDSKRDGAGCDCNE